MSRVVLVALLVALATACAQGGGAGDVGTGDASSDSSTDSGGRDTEARDTGMRDTTIPGDMCGMVTCMAFEECIMGACAPLPACVADSECSEGRICLHRFCIPASRDVDGDGFVAADDCDETNPDINPGEDEVCNTIDDNCSGAADDGDPGLMCAMDPAGGICIDGACGCPDGVFDIDRDPTNGCECTALPGLMLGESCGMPIDLGDVSDIGETTTATGNLLPEGREIWYRFRGVDTADTACDNLHVRVQFTTNPGSAYALNVFRGDCATAECDPAMTYQDFSWATDFRADIAGTLTGECPCTTTAARRTDVSLCTDQTTEYFVRVVRLPTATVSCDPYTLEVTNGVYDTTP